MDIISAIQNKIRSLDPKTRTRLGIALIVAFLLTTEFSNILLTFLLAGIIPGTQIVIPYWFMMGVYCVLISLIATPYIEWALKALHERQKTAN